MDYADKNPGNRISSSGCVCATFLLVNNYLFFSGVGDCVILLKRGKEMEDVLPKHQPIEREEHQRIHVSE